VLAQAVMETEVSGQIGAAPYERSSERIVYRTRRWDTRVGTIELKIPKGQRRCLLPKPARTSPKGREGASRGRRRGLREGCVDSKTLDELGSRVPNFLIYG
jgi:transposase-like protein